MQTLRVETYETRRVDGGGGFVKPSTVGRPTVNFGLPFSSSLCAEMKMESPKKALYRNPRSRSCQSKYGRAGRMSGDFYGSGSNQSQCGAKDGSRRPVEGEEEDGFDWHTWSPLGPGMKEVEAKLDWRLI